MVDAVAELSLLTSRPGYSLSSIDRHGRRDESPEGTFVGENDTPGREQMT